MLTETEFTTAARFEYGLTELQMRTLISMLRLRRFFIKNKVGGVKISDECDYSSKGAAIGSTPISSVRRFQDDMGMGFPVLENWDEDQNYHVEDVVFPLVKKGYITHFNPESKSKLPRGITILPGNKTIWSPDALHPASEKLKDPYYCLTSSGLVVAGVLETEFIMNGIIQEFTGETK